MNKRIGTSNSCALSFAQGSKRYSQMTPRVEQKVGFSSSLSAAIFLSAKTSLCSRETLLAMASKLSFSRMGLNQIVESHYSPDRNPFVLNILSATILIAVNNCHDTNYSEPFFSAAA